MKKQEKLIQEKRWDVLIILDACRYDFFKGVYSDYLRGNLMKVKSPDCGTRRWLKSVFEEKSFEDTVYVSGNPFTNSSNIEIPQINKQGEKEHNEGFDGDSWFHDVINVWAWESGVAKPSKVIDGFKKAQVEYPSKRKIVHFLQPHGPYLDKIGKDIDFLFFSSSSENSNENEENSSKEVKNFNWKKSMENLLKKEFGEEFLAYLKDFLGLGKGSVKQVLITEGSKGLTRHYEYNLRKVLESLSPLVKKLDGKIVITSDHGEFLGEKYSNLNKEQRKIFDAAKEVEGDFGIVQFTDRNGERYIAGHPYKVNHPILREVPWLEIEK